jgi:hypothetical protein
MRQARAAALAASALAIVLVVGAPEPDLRPCGWDDSVVAEFSVADRRELAARVPGLASAPEVTDPNAILMNGEPAGLARAPLEVRVMRCVRGDQLAILPALVPGWTPPSEYRGVVAITTAAGEQSVYTDIDLAGLLSDR